MNNRELPTFIVVGAMKAGTTSLAAYLGSHPEVFVTTPKEARFFGSSSDENWPRGLGWYRQLFTSSAGARARGEASPGYTMAPHVPHVPERIASVVPDVRLVYLLRNPVGRIRSAYIDRSSRGVESMPLREALHAKRGTSMPAGTRTDSSATSRTFLANRSSRCRLRCSARTAVPYYEMSSSSSASIQRSSRRQRNVNTTSPPRSGSPSACTRR